MVRLPAATASRPQLIGESRYRLPPLSVPTETLFCTNSFSEASLLRDCAVRQTGSCCSAWLGFTETGLGRESKCRRGRSVETSEIVRNTTRMPGFRTISQGSILVPLELRGCFLTR